MSLGLTPSAPAEAAATAATASASSVAPRSMPPRSSRIAQCPCVVDEHRQMSTQRWIDVSNSALIASTARERYVKSNARGPFSAGTAKSRK
jgi:hypothetical protein